MADNKKVPTTFDSLYKLVDKKRKNYNRLFLTILLIISLSAAGRSYYLNRNSHVPPKEVNTTVTPALDSAKQQTVPMKKEHKKRIKHAPVTETVNSPQM